MKAPYWGLIGLAAGALFSGLLSKSCADKAISNLQEQSKRALAEVNAYADAQARVADSLRAQGNRIIHVVEKDTLAAQVAHQALEIAQTARDSNAIYREENASLRSAQLGLFQALALARAESDSLRARGDSLQRTADSLGRGIANLKPRPQWLKIVTKAVKVVAIFELGRQSTKVIKGEW